MNNCVGCNIVKVKIPFKTCYGCNQKNNLSKIKCKKSDCLKMIDKKYIICYSCSNKKNNNTDLKNNNVFIE